MTAVPGRSPWPRWRAVSGVAGLAVAAAAVTGPVAQRADGDLRWHVAGHLLLGMVAPLLLVLAAPVTLLLRTLPPVRARAVTRLLRRRPVRVLTHPLVAAALDVGGLWLVYVLAPLAEPIAHPAGHASAAASVHALVHPLVHLHMLLAGFLFTTAVVGVDPMPHRPRPPVRALALVLAGAGHTVLAKVLYGHPPAGVDVEEARQAAVLLSYGSDVVEIVLAVLLCAAWLRPRGGRPGRRSPGRRGQELVSARHSGSSRP